MLLGILVLSTVGTYLYGSIAQGLVDGRQRIAADDSLRDATDAQKQFDSTDQTASVAELTQTATDLVNKYRRDAGNEVRYVVLTRLEHQRPADDHRSDRERRGGGAGSSPRSSRGRSRRPPSVQHLQVATIEEDTGEISAVIVGQKIVLPGGG